MDGMALERIAPRRRGISSRPDPAACAAPFSTVSWDSSWIVMGPMGGDTPSFPSGAARETGRGRRDQTERSH